MPKRAYSYIISCSLAVLGLAILPLHAHAKNLNGTAVVLRALDKVTATTNDYKVKLGDVLQYGSLTIEAVHCEKRPPEEPPETYGFLKIKNTKLDGKGQDGEQETLFSGWMFASRPAVSALDHGVYDVWVIDCEVPAAPKLPETKLPETKLPETKLSDTELKESLDFRGKLR